MAWNRKKKPRGNTNDEPKNAFPIRNNWFFSHLQVNIIYGRELNLFVQGKSDNGALQKRRNIANCILKDTVSNSKLSTFLDTQNMQDRNLDRKFILCQQLAKKISAFCLKTHCGKNIFKAIKTKRLEWYKR